MKLDFTLIVFVAAGISLFIGIIGKISGVNFYFANATWHMFAQTCLLFAIGWKLYKKS